MFHVFHPRKAKNWFQNWMPEFSSKIALKVTPANPFWVPKGSRIHVRETNNHKNGVKTCFFWQSVSRVNFERPNHRIWTSPEGLGPAGRPQTLKTHVHDLAGSGRIWRDLTRIFGIIRAWQLPLALRLPNPLITRKLVDWKSEVVLTRSTAEGSADKY